MRRALCFLLLFAATSWGQALSSTFTSNNGQAGNMFDLVALNDVTIDRFDVNLDVGTWNLEVYTKSSAYLPDVNNAAAWTLVSSFSGIVSAGPDQPTALPGGMNVLIPAGTTQAFYVTVTNGASINYTNGSTTGALYAQDSNLQFFEGAGLVYPFTNNFNPRIWNGTIHYAVTPIAPPSIQDSYFWGSTSQVFGAGNIIVWDHDGATVTTFPLQFGSVVRVVKTPQLTWIADTAKGELIPYTLAGGPGAAIPTTPLSSIAAFADGSIATFGGGLFLGPVTVTKRDGTGAMLWTTTATLSAARDVIVSPVTNDVWILGQSNPPAIERFNGTTGASMGYSTLTAAGTAIQFRTDAAGNIWVLTAGTGITPELTRTNSDGVQNFNIAVPGAKAFAVDELGRARVLVDTGNGHQVQSIDPAFGFVIGSFPVAGAWDGFTIDPLGNHWLSNTNGFAMALYDKWGDFKTNITPGGPVGAANNGDATGLHLTLLTQNQDLDGDGWSSLQEAKLGSDPLNIASEPASLTLVPAPVNGQITTFTVDAPDFAGYPFLTAAAAMPVGLPISAVNALEYPLTIDPLFDLWINPMLNFFVFIPGTTTPSIGSVLDASGHGELDFVIPFGIGGFQFWLCAGFINPGTGEVMGFTPGTLVAIQ